MISNETVVDTLKQVRQLLEKGWCKGDFAIDANDEPAMIESADACRWCIVGAVYRACNIQEYDPEHSELVDTGLSKKVLAELEATLCASHEGSIKTLPQFNDEQESVEPVLDLIDKTSERLQARSH